MVNLQVAGLFACQGCGQVETIERKHVIDGRASCRDCWSDHQMALEAEDRANELNPEETHHEAL